jgi:hypothetical protein
LPALSEEALRPGGGLSSTRVKQVQWKMDQNTKRLIEIAERLLRELDHQVPPQPEMLDELRALLVELRRDAQVSIKPNADV